MRNLALHVTIPASLKLVDGSILETDITFDFISQLEPYYASVDQVRLAGGTGLRRLSDLAIACQIYQSSQEADLINLHPPLAGDTQKRFVGSRNQWTTATAARDLLLGLEILLSPGAHVLANFSVTRNRALQEEGLSARLKELNDSIKYYEVTIKSGGATTPGGHVKAAMAAKGINDWSEKSPARTWFGNGMGANATSVDPGSPTGGRGKPVKFFASPLYSPPFTSLRIGVYQAGYPLAIVYPYPVGQ